MRKGWPQKTPKLLDRIKKKKSLEKHEHFINCYFEQEILRLNSIERKDAWALLLANITLLSLQSREMISFHVSAYTSIAHHHSFD